MDLEERTYDPNDTGPLPELPDSCYPEGAVPLDAPLEQPGIVGAGNQPEVGVPTFKNVGS